ncbi:FHA domain-containing protein [Thalassotalea sp. PLHSN55]|uniref:FHA domain-containing protein n=1 Tax=Thalassotalea sp. PLHSN55 TaxID=3435888 RepID=UPI003F839F1F
MELIIEEISRGHKLLGRHKFAQKNIRIGRGYQNDIILDDPHICPDHLHINFDGENWIVTDENSINGSYLEDGKRTVSQHIVKSGDVISFGKSQIRLLFPNHPVAESVEFSPFESLIDFARQPIALIASISLFAFIAGYIFFLNQTIEVPLTKIAVPAIGMTLMFALWPGAVALVSHLTKHESRILSQLGVAFLLYNLMWVSDIIESIAGFNLSANWPVGLLTTLLPIALAFCLFWLNCYIGFHMNAKRRLIISSALTCLVFGGTFLIQLSKTPEFRSQPQYDATIMTPSFLFSSGSTTDKFIADSNKLFMKVDKEAQEDKE